MLSVALFYQWACYISAKLWIERHSFSENRVLSWAPPLFLSINAKSFHSSRVLNKTKVFPKSERQIERRSLFEIHTKALFFSISDILVRKNGSEKNSSTWKLSIISKKISSGSMPYPYAKNWAIYTRKKSLTMPNWAEFCVNRPLSLKKSSVARKTDFALILNTLGSDSTDKDFRYFLGYDLPFNYR